MGDAVSQTVARPPTTSSLQKSRTQNVQRARRSGHPSSTTQETRRSRPVGVSEALPWDMKTSEVGMDAVRQLHSTRRSSSCPTQTCHQRPWSVHLGQPLQDAENTLFQ